MLEVGYDIPKVEGDNFGWLARKFVERLMPKNECEIKLSCCQRRGAGI